MHFKKADGRTLSEKEILLVPDLLAAGAACCSILPEASLASCRSELPDWRVTAVSGESLALRFTDQPGEERTAAGVVLRRGWLFVMLNKLWQFNLPSPIRRGGGDHDWPSTNRLSLYPHHFSSFFIAGSLSVETRAFDWPCLLDQALSLVSEYLLFLHFILIFMSFLPNPVEPLLGLACLAHANEVSENTITSETSAPPKLDEIYPYIAEFQQWWWENQYCRLI